MRTLHSVSLIVRNTSFMCFYVYGYYSVSIVLQRETVFKTVAVLAGTGLIFFTEAGMMLCFGL